MRAHKGRKRMLIPVIGQVSNLRDHNTFSTGLLIMLRPIRVIGRLRKTPPQYSGFPGGGNPYRYFQNYLSDGHKIFLGQLEHICSSEKFFRDPQNILAP